MVLVKYFFLLFMTVILRCSVKGDALELQATAKITYEKISSCIEKDPRQAGKTKTWALPNDVEEHYRDLLAKTSVFREVPYHSAGDYAGPWIENHFIKHFIDKPLSYFRGFIPIFVQWVDIHCYEFIETPKNESWAVFKKLPEILRGMLRHDVLYLVVTQDDQGLTSAILSEFPNIFSLSAGGFGHVPIPLIKGDMKYKPPPQQYTHKASFLGNVRPRLSRFQLINSFKSQLEHQGINVHVEQTHNWPEIMENTLLNLAPRGYGRTSYRMAEIIQMGRIPVYMYDDVEWLPYAGSNISIQHYGFSGHPPTFRTLAQTLSAVIKDEKQVGSLLQAVRDVRSYFTYEGVLQQIELFIADPFGSSGGYLSCVALPHKDHRRHLIA